MDDSILIQKIRELKISSPTIADVLDGMEIDGVLDGSIHALNKSVFYIVGYAYTVQWGTVRKTHNIMKSRESTWDQVKSFLVPEIKCGENLVYMAGSGPLLTTAALAGGLSATYFDHIGFEGVILGGAARDAAEINQLDTPILATNLIPTDTQGAFRVTNVGESCNIAGKVVATGDLVVSDENGTVTIPRSSINDVFERAIAIQSIEEQIIRQVKNGANLQSLIEEYGRI